MRRTRLPTLAALLCGLALGLAAGCEPALDLGGGGGSAPPGVSNITCFQDTDCVPTNCCGNAASVTHVEEAPNCRGVFCGPCDAECGGDSCSPDTLRCGTCIPVCRNSRCASACS
jgi:hypothetical protein